MRGLYALKPWYTRRLDALLDGAVARRVSPDLFTGIGVLAAAMAGMAIWRGWWIVAGVALAARLAGANLDGAVARARRVSRPWGFVLNEIGDRASDVLMFAGLAALAARTSPGSGPVILALIAAIAASWPTFASLSAVGAGGARRLNGGPLGKTERCALAVLAAAVPSWLVPIGWVIILGSVLTALLRLRAAHDDLRRR